MHYVKNRVSCGVMKTFFSITTILFALITLLPFVNVIVSDAENFDRYLGQVCPIYLSIGIVGMLLMAYMGDKYENKI